MPHREPSTARSVQAVPFRTDLQWMAIALRGEAVAAVCFGYKSPQLAARALCGKLPEELEIVWVDRPDSRREDLMSRLKSFAAGHPQDFRDIPLDLDDRTDFQRRVIRACRRLAWGQTASYAELAARAGTPRAARAVGHVMATNRFPLLVPCHRVIAANGSLGGYSAPTGLAMKRRLLRMEGSLS